MAEVTEAMLDAAAEVFGTYDVPRDWLRNALEAAQTAAPDPWRPIDEYDRSIEPHGFVLCDIPGNEYAIVGRRPVKSKWWQDAHLRAIERPTRFMPLPKLVRPAELAGMEAKDDHVG